MANILVVDDHRDGRDFLSTLLGYRGHVVTVAEDGEQALRVMHDLAPDLVVSDILMPKVDGYELVRQMREDPRVASTPVIFYTAGYETDSARSLAHSVGVIQFLQKPADPRLILGIIDAALGAEPAPLVPEIEPASFERDHRALLTSALAQRVDELKAEVEERERAEARIRSLDASLDDYDLQSFLLGLADKLRAIRSPLAVMRTASEMVGRHLSVGRVGYCEVDETEGVLTYPTGWSDGTIEPLTGSVPLTILGGLTADLKAGRSVVVEDVDLDPRIVRGSFASATTRAMIVVPLIRDGSWVADFFVHHATARAWRADEVTLVREVLARTWDALERARAENALHRLQARQALMFDLIWEQRKARDERAVLDSAAASLGAFLNADRTGFYEIDALGVMSFPGQWSSGKIEVFSRDIPVVALSEKVRAIFARGEDLVFSDVDKNSDDFFFFRDLGIVANIGISVIRDGQWRMGFYVNQGKPRRWNADEISLARNVAEVSWDAVERLRAVEELKVRQAPAKTWELHPDLYCVVDERAFFERINPAWTVLLGWSFGEVSQGPFFDLLHPDDVEPTRAVYDDVVKGHPALHHENRYRTKSGDYRWLSWIAIPENGKIYCTARDITAEKAAAGALTQTQDALRQAQKMEAVGQLTGGLAHDFNNLLTGISGSLEMLEVRVKQGRVGELDKYILTAQGASKRAAALTHRLLAFSRRQTLDPIATDVARLVNGMTELIVRTVGPEIKVETVNMIGLWTALVDPNQLENALLNLCINARDAMPDGGRLTIETNNKWMDDRAAAERDVAPGQYLSLCVSDTGSGMPADVIARAFDPFFTTKPLGLGTGLGLSMIYGFARQSGGQVRIYSEVDEGTIVCIYLPRHYGEQEVAEAPAFKASSARAGDGETVLIVDDEPSVRMLVGDVLSDLGYGAIEAEDGAAGLQVLQSSRRVDLLVTDVGLPGGMNGRQVADAARAIRPELKVLFITGYAENAAVGNGQLDPGMAVLTKPFAVDELTGKVRELIKPSESPTSS